MAKRTKVTVLHETSTGLNDRLLIHGKTYTNNQAYSLVKKGMTNGLVEVKNENGTKYIRSSPDLSKANNIEKNNKR